MKEKNKYHIADIVNIVVFYCVFLCFLTAFIVGTVDIISGNLKLSSYLFRIAFLFVMCLPYIIKKTFKIIFTKATTIIYYVYMFLSAFLGTVIGFYNTIPVWDMVIHFLMGVVLALFAVYILNYSIYKKDKSKHNVVFTFLFMILLSMGIGALWEIWEFSGDILFGLSSQRYLDANMHPLVGQAALIDTMIDLCMDFLGSIIAVVAVGLISIYNKKFLKTFVIKKMNRKKEIESIEE